MLNTNQSPRPAKDDYSTFEVVVIDRDEDFAALEEEWEDLHRNSPLATPFQSWAWLFTWWEHYGESYELRLVTIREGGLLVGLMPLMLERRGGFGRLLFVSTGLTDYHDILAREGWEAQVAQVGRRALKQMRGWQVVDLQQLRPEAMAWSIFKAWSGPRRSVWQDNCPMIEVKPWDELIASLTRKKLRSSVRQTIRRSKEDEVYVELASADDAEWAARRCVALHREMWQERDIAQEHLTRRFESHIQSAAKRLTICGLGGISHIWRDGEVILSQFLLFGSDFVGQYMFGATQDAMRRFQVSSLNIWDLMNVALRRGSVNVDLLRGEEPYKLQWVSEVGPNYRAILGRNPALWSAYAGYHVLHSEIRRYERSESTPQWVKGVAGMYRTVRSTGLAERVKRAVQR
jgi:CelD/BcsL family acetyltransferase involved in cellulose biosynthesis